MAISMVALVATVDKTSNFVNNIGSQENALKSYLLSLCTCLSRKCHQRKPNLTLLFLHFNPEEGNCTLRLLCLHCVYCVWRAGLEENCLVSTLHGEIQIEYVDTSQFTCILVH